MADFLGGYFGAEGSRIFKPVISSQGDNVLLYGKTAFVYNPKYDAIFKKNPNLDILMASSAEKLGAYKVDKQGNLDPHLLTVSHEQLVKGNIDVGNKLLEIPLDAVKTFPNEICPNTL